jgi:hypothetical protein
MSGHSGHSSHVHNVTRQVGGALNLTIKTIRKAVLLRCEWGRDDYTLGLANLGPAPLKPGLQGSRED